jgi:hypothetical protein
VPGPRRLSQRISEGDGIAIIVRVADVESARAAEAEGAKALAVAHAIAGIREATSLPLLWIGSTSPTDADAVILRPEGHANHDTIEFVVDVRDEEELELALELLDPEIFLLSGEGSDEHDDPLDAVLELLPDVPAGKLAIADVAVASRDEVLALERAGIDAVLVPAGSVAGLVGHAPFEV